MLTKPRIFEDVKSVTFKCDKSFFEKYLVSDTAKISEVVRKRIVASENLKDVLSNLLDVFLKIATSKSLKVLNEEDFTIVREAEECIQ